MKRARNAPFAGVDAGSALPAEAYESVSSHPDEFIEQGDTVVVLGHTEARTNSGNAVKVPFAHVWRMSGGTIQRGQLLTDTSVILKALDD